HLPVAVFFSRYGTEFLWDLSGITHDEWLPCVGMKLTFVVALHDEPLQSAQHGAIVGCRHSVDADESRSVENPDIVREPRLLHVLRKMDRLLADQSLVAFRPQADDQRDASRAILLAYIFDAFSDLRGADREFCLAGFRTGDREEESRSIPEVAKVIDRAGT